MALSKGDDMRKVLLLLLLSVIGVSLYAFTQRKPLHRKDNLKLKTVSSVFAMDQETLAQNIVRVFRHKRLPTDNKFSRFTLAQAGDEKFPAEYQLTHYKDDESVARYLSIPLERRKLDFYLYDYSDADKPTSYWASEYYQGDEPTLFRCNFIIHHEPDGKGGTLVEIFEFAPRVWVGKKFGFEAHGPGYYLDIRDVAPTTSDRVELLDLLKETTRK